MVYVCIAYSPSCTPRSWCKFRLIYIIVVLLLGNSLLQVHCNPLYMTVVYTLKHVHVK